MRLTAKPVAAAQASKTTRTANPQVAVLCGGAPARVITTREEKYATIAAPGAVSRDATIFPCVTVLSLRGAFGAVLAMALPTLLLCV
jgi:hypothetical protein